MRSILQTLALSLSVLAVLCAGLLGSPRAYAAGFGAYKADVAQADVFPGADRFGPVEGKPAAQAAYKGDKLAGYVFEAVETGYSGKPIRVLAGLDLNGVITGAKVAEHHEPILLIGIPADKLFDFVGRYTGRNIIDVSKDAASSKKVDVISGATVTAVVINDGLTRTAIALAKSRGIAGFPPVTRETPSAKPTLTLAKGAAEPQDWAKLLGIGLVKRLHLSNADVDEAFRKIGVGSPEPYARAGVPEQDFIDLYVGLLDVEATARSLLSDADVASIHAWLKPGESALILAANGDYSFRGSGFVRGGIFDRIQLVQDDQTILFKDKDYRRIDKVSAGGAPEFKEVGIFRVPEGTAFSPAAPFRVDLLAQRPTGPIEKAYTSFSVGYSVPQAFLSVAAVPALAAPAKNATVEDEQIARDAVWPKIWRDHAPDVALLALALAMLTGIFFFQDWLVQHPVLFARLRTGFLLFSVLFLGLYAKAQLSVVNVLTFAQSVLTGFRWDFFLLEPLIFILWCGTAIGLLFWGRGVYCGWLCPFGSLQELMNHAARRLGICQITVPFYLHERLWALKYILFLGLLGVSLGSMATAEQLAEIEPFKTVVVLHFVREWWFVLFALALLTAGLFIERFYCRYLCVLGAALAIPGRGRMFDWLKRRKQCGVECQVCAKGCMVGAIHPLGQINPNECLYCMHCQVIYWDDHKCPPLIMKREGRGKKRAAGSTNETAGPPLKPPAAITFTYNAKERNHVDVE